MYSSQIQLEHV
jgi:hypothetical protein